MVSKRIEGWEDQRKTLRLELEQYQDVLHVCGRRLVQLFKQLTPTPRHLDIAALVVRTSKTVFYKMPFILVLASWTTNAAIKRLPLGDPRRDILMTQAKLAEQYATQHFQHEDAASSRASEEFKVQPVAAVCNFNPMVHAPQLAALAPNTALASYLAGGGGSISSVMAAGSTRAKAEDLPALEAAIKAVTAEVSDALAAVRARVDSPAHHLFNNVLHPETHAVEYVASPYFRGLLRNTEYVARGLVRVELLDTVQHISSVLSALDSELDMRDYIDAQVSHSYWVLNHSCSGHVGCFTSSAAA